MSASRVDKISHALIKHVLTPLGIAVAFVIVALLWTFPLQHVISYPFVFLFFGAIMGSAWFGGATAGFVAVCLSSVLITYLFIPPFYSMTVAKQSQSFLTAFIVSSIAISFVSSARKKSENAIREARDHLEEKVQERTAELERSNREILENDRQLRLLTEAIPQQIWRADASGTIEYCNQHLVDYLGTAALGDSFFDIFHPDDLPIFRQEWMTALRSGGDFEAEVRVRGKSGDYRWFLLRSVPQRAADGSIARWYGTHIDIEAQHRAQQSLAQAHEEQARIAHTLSMAEMAASIAHELNQPLTAVITHAYACREWLQSQPINLARAATTAERIVEESTRAGDVVRRVRALFRKEAYVREQTDLPALVRNSLRLLRDEAIRREVMIRFHIASDLAPAEVDPVQIQQVILNLAINGIEAMDAVPPPRKLSVRVVQHSPREILIAVEDQGPGIAPEVAARMFEPFFTTKKQGTGMGLAICRSIVESHDGHIWARALAAGGTSVQFTLRTKQ